MHDAERSTRIARGEWLALAGIGLAFVLLRLPLLTDPGLHLGWNSDAAIFGLMAKAIFAGSEYPIFFWGQSYMGPLTSVIAAAVGAIAGAVGPLALRLAVMIEVAAAIVLYWAALRRAFGARVATLTALWLAIGPGWLFFFTIAPIGGEQMLLLSAVIFWYSVRTELRGRHDWFVFGVLAGIGWWIHQGVIFAIGASLLIVILRSDAWARAWPEPKILDRLFLRDIRTRWRIADPLLAKTLIALNALLLLWIADGALFSAELPVPALFLRAPLLEPLIVFAFVRLVLALVYDDDLRGAMSRASGVGGRGSEERPGASPPTPDPRPLTPFLFICGAILGYAPVIAGGLLNLYPRTYGLSVPPQSVRGVVEHFAVAVRADFWKFIGAGRSPAEIVVGAAMVALLVVALLRHWRALLDLLTLRPRDYGPRGIAAATMLLCILFYLISRRAHEGSVRYVVSALPMLYAFAAREVWELRSRIVAIAAALAVTLALTVPRIVQAGDVAGGRGEEYSNLGGNFDPRPTLRAIESRGYSLCYAEYWIAYKLEWVSEGRVRFIPFHSFDRTPATSQLREREPGPKCYVDGKGAVRPFDPREFDESLMHKARERLLMMEQ